jgi:hypothetical protein
MWVDNTPHSHQPLLKKKDGREKEEEILRERKLRRTRRSLELRLQKLGGCSGTWHDSKVTHQESGRRVKADTARARMGESDGEETGGVSFRSVGYKEC